MKKHNKPLIIANWKMNLLKNQAIELVSKLSELNDIPSDLVICPPDLLINLIKNQTNIPLGAQNCSAQEDDFGAYTGDISAYMLKNIGCEYVIIGHSERRKYQQEDNNIIAKKITKAHDCGLIAIFCVGENLEEREQERSYDIVLNQLTALPSSATSENTIIAYEPVWAIGTGKSASLTEINLMHDYIRSVLFEKHFKLVYGGSVKCENAKEILSLEQVDGLLVGAASLDFEQFYKIIK
jgi:triosephosphate isomerase